MIAIGSVPCHQGITPIRVDKVFFQNSYSYSFGGRKRFIIAGENESFPKINENFYKSFAGTFSAIERKQQAENWKWASLQATYGFIWNLYRQLLSYVNHRYTFRLLYITCVTPP